MPSNLDRIENLTWGELKKEMRKLDKKGKSAPRYWVEAGWDPVSGVIRYSVFMREKVSDNPS